MCADEFPYADVLHLRNGRTAYMDSSGHKVRTNNSGKCDIMVLISAGDTFWNCHAAVSISLKISGMVRRKQKNNG